MTADDYRSLFIGKILIVDDNYYHLDDKGNFLLAKGDNSVNGTYEFKQREDKVYFRTKPSIYPEGHEIEVTLYLGTHRVLFVNE